MEKEKNKSTNQEQKKGVRMTEEELIKLGFVAGKKHQGKISIRTFNETKQDTKNK